VFVKERGPGTLAGVAVKLDFAENSRKMVTVVDRKTVKVEVLKHCVGYTPGFCRNQECAHFSCYDAHSGKQRNQDDSYRGMEVI
jgi:hypothetical protein